MPTVKFFPNSEIVEVDSGTKLLVSARKAKTNIRFGCASCRCGTCAVRVTSGSLTDKDSEEVKMLEKLKLDADPQIRMACRARLQSENVEVDLDFQDTYDIPDEFE